MRSKQVKSADSREKALRMYLYMCIKAMPEHASIIYQSRGIMLEFLDYYFQDARSLDPNVFLNTFDHFFYMHYGILTVHEDGSTVNSLQTVNDYPLDQLIWDYAFSAPRMRNEVSLWLLSFFGYNPILKGRILDTIKAGLYDSLKAEVSKIKTLEDLDLYITLNRWTHNYLSKNREELMKLLSGSTQ